MRPFSTSCITAVATKVLVIEAMWKSDRGVTGVLALQGQDAEAVLVDDPAVVDDGDRESGDLLLPHEVLEKGLQGLLVRVPGRPFGGTAAARDREREAEGDEGAAFHGAFAAFCTPLEMSRILPEWLPLIPLQADVIRRSTVPSPSVSPMPTASKPNVSPGMRQV